jgi:outer membrane protein
MKKTAAALVMGALAIPASHADTIFGIYASGARWNADITGDFRSEGAVDIETGQLGLEDTGSNVFHVAIEHGVPLMPNVRLRHTDLSWNETATITTPVTFEGSSFKGAVTSELDFSHLDGTMYYEILDNIVSLDVGITARIFDGRISLRDATAAQELTLDAGIPMLYGNVQFDLPLTGLYAGAETNVFTLSGNTLQDSVIRIGYESSLGLGAEAGYRSLTLDLDDLQDVYSSLESKGAYLAGTFHF